MALMVGTMRSIIWSISTGTMYPPSGSLPMRVALRWICLKLRGVALAQKVLEGLLVLDLLVGKALALGADGGPIGLLGDFVDLLAERAEIGVDLGDFFDGIFRRVAFGLDRGQAGVVDFLELFEGLALLGEQFSQVV
ncbi:MAG: hypothetical protein IPK39_23105 [Sulfuritalea sp.]|nr:hypothetical protein [Sulfuritalea sp.]